MRRVAVIGGGIGGLAAAGVLARSGCEVVLYEATGAVGGKAGSVRCGGLKLDTGPTLLTLPQVVRGLFDSLGAGELLPRLIELDEQCRYHFPGGQRLSTYRDVERTAAEVARELGEGEAAGIRAFYRDAERLWDAAGAPYLMAPYRGALALLGQVLRRSASPAMARLALSTVAGMAERHFRSEELRAFAGRFATYAGASPWDASAVLGVIPHVERAFGVHHVEGGMGALVAALEQAVRGAGVRIDLGRRAGWRRSGDGGWTVGPQGAEERFDAAVINADPLAALGREREPLALSGYVLLLRADRRLALPHHSIYFARDYRGEFRALSAGGIASDLTLYLCHPAASDAGAAPEGESGLYAMVNAPAFRSEEERARWPERAAALRRWTLERLRRIPELSGARIEVLGERTPEDLARLGAPGGSIYGFLPRGSLATFLRPPQRAREPGLFFAGGGTHPGGGVPMVMLSGQHAAQLALEHLERARAPRRRTAAAASPSEVPT
jgi:phytoene desaturase